MNFKPKEYLPNSEGRITHLREIIKGRPVAILAAGPSINELEKRITELRYADICYFGLNSFVQEKYILQKIDKHVSVYMDSCCDNIPHTIKDIIRFLNRDEDNIFVSSFYNNTFGQLDGNFNLNQFLTQYDRKLIFFSLSNEKTVPNEEQPIHFPLGNSLMILIQLAIIGKASRIVLFGADGGCKEPTEEYCYRQSEYHTAPLECYNWDTNVAFNPVLPIAIRNVYQTYDLDKIVILNCSQDSLYTPFPVISYDDAFEYLLKCKKFDRRSDLRIPKVSVISICTDSIKYLKETVEGISDQSYSNHEHIVVDDKSDDEKRNAMQQYPHVRWISEKNAGYLESFKRGISMARGEYIFHCRIADGYLNQDWLNTCVEILENNPDVSLVWGLSQYILDNGKLGRIPDAYFLDKPPSQKKYFLYYWLKKKVLFPAGNVCVRKRVLEECFPFSSVDIHNEHEAWISFNYRFNVLGYLPYFVPIVANYNKIQSDADQEVQCSSSSRRRWVETYYKDIEQYKRRLSRRQIDHCYRAGSGESLLGGFSRRGLFFYVIGRYIKETMPKVCLIIIEKALFFWKTYRWGALSVIPVRAWCRLMEEVTYQTSNKVNNAKPN